LAYPTIIIIYDFFVSFSAESSQNLPKSSTRYRLLSLGPSRNGVAQTSNPPDTADVLTIQTVELTVYRTKEPGTAPAAKRETKGKSAGRQCHLGPGLRDGLPSVTNLFPIRGSGLVQSV
jgi:hypothetical protein